MTLASRMLITERRAQSGLPLEVLAIPDRDQGSLSPRLDRRAARVMAETRLHSALRSITLDILGPCDPDDFPDELAAWIDEAADAAASAVCERSMTALIRALDAAIERAPRDMVNRLNVAALRHYAGQI